MVNKFINKDNLSSFCITNNVKGDIKALAVEFPGLDGNSCLSGNFEKTELDRPFAKALEEAGILLVYVFTGPWNWMRDLAVSTVNDIIDAVKDKFSLADDIKTIAVGGSMGGLGALMYTLKGDTKISACAVSCPVCDFEEAFYKYPYWGATLYFAFGDCNGDFWDVIKEKSPINNVDKFPDIPYFLIACGKDVDVPYEKHAKRLIDKMYENNLNLEYTFLPENGHCVHSDDAMKLFIEFIINNTK